jgi:hypothetical protein
MLQNPKFTLDLSLIENGVGFSLFFREKSGLFDRDQYVFYQCRHRVPVLAGSSGRGLQ